MTEFNQFMRGLRADVRLGRYVAPVADQPPEIVVLSLALALATATEGKAPHPAMTLLARMEERG